jgi:hypothetical protein
MATRPVKSRSGQRDRPKIDEPSGSESLNKPTRLLSSEARTILHTHSTVPKPRARNHRSNKARDGQKRPGEAKFRNISILDVFNLREKRGGHEASTAPRKPASLPEQ